MIHSPRGDDIMHHSITAYVVESAYYNPFAAEFFVSNFHHLKLELLT